MYLNVTGESLLVLDPMDVFINNIVVDVSRQGTFLRSFEIFWNYPEAAVNGEVYVNNIRAEKSQENGKQSYLIVGAHFPSNQTYSNINWSQHSLYDDLQSWVGLGTRPNWNPIDELSHIISVDTWHDDGSQENIGLGKTFFNLGTAFVGFHRQVHNKMSNFTFANIKQSWTYGLLYSWGAGNDITIFSNFIFRNCSSKIFFVQALNHEYLEFKNFTIEDSEDHPGGVLNIDIPGDLIMKNFMFRNYKNRGLPKSPAFYLSASPTSTITLEGIWLKDSEISNSPLIFTPSSFGRMLITSIELQNMLIPTEGSVLRFDNWSSLLISNVTFENVTPLDESDVSASLIQIKYLDYEHMDIIAIQDATFSNSSISIVKIDSISAFSLSQRSIIFDHIHYYNSEILTARSILATDGFSGELNLDIWLSNLHFENITFMTGGYIIDWQHRLPNAVEIINSTFVNITRGGILVSGSLFDHDYPTKLKIVGTSSSDWYMPAYSFITTNQGAVVRIERSSFLRFSSLSFMSGIMNVMSSSQVFITDSTFQNNSAMINSIFLVESEGMIKWLNWSIFGNFAVTNGVFEASSSGIIIFEKSDFYRNYAIKAPIGTIFVVIDPSIVQNTQIHSNGHISKIEIQTEISEDWVKLWFLSDEMKIYLKNLDLNSITESEALIQLLQGELLFFENSRVYSEDSQIFSCFSSTMRVENSMISDINSSKSAIEAISSVVSVNNVTAKRVTSSNGLTSYGIFEIISGTLNVSTLRFQDSRSQPIQLLFSEGSFNQLEFEGITSSQLLLVRHSKSFTLSNISVVNVTVSSDSLVKIHDSQNISLKDIDLKEVQNKLSSFINSQVSSIENIWSTGWRQVFHFERCTVNTLSDSLFLNSSLDHPQRGGAIAIENSQVLIHNTTFSGNSASAGGAIYFGWTSLDICNLEIKNCTFSQNSALVKGGAIYYNYNSPKMSQINFNDNFAPYGPNLASYPSRIGLVGSKQNDEIVLSDVGSGIRIPQTIKLALFDINDQIMNLDNSSLISIIPRNTSKVSLKGANVISMTKGIAEFDNMAAIIDLDYRVANFSLNWQIIDKNKVKNVLGSDYQQNDLVIHFRDCQPGERILGNQCDVWAAGTYSLTWNSTKCKKWGLNVDWLGGQHLSLKHGHWRRFSNSTEIVEWINKDAWDGGYTPLDLSPAQWAKGYTGVLWAQWLVNSEVKYERFNDFQWRKWPNTVWNSIQIIATMLIVLGFIIFVIIINVRKTNESEFSVLLRILANYLQLLAVSTSMTNDYPSALFALAIPIKMFGSPADILLSFDCFFEETEMKLIFSSNAILKMFMLLFLPLVLFLIMVVMWTSLYLLKKEWVKDLKRNIAISFITIIFLLHPKLAERSIGIFKWIELEEGFSVVKFDTNLECLSSTHIKSWVFITIPMLMIWVFICPLLALSAIYNRKESPTQARWHEYLLMMYQGLNPEAIYWEFVNTIRKVTMFVSLLFSKVVAINISLVVLLFTARLELHVKPYRNSEYYMVEFHAITAGALTIATALIYSQDEKIDLLDQLVFGIIILFNIKFLAEWLSLLFYFYRNRNRVLGWVRS